MSQPVLWSCDRQVVIMVFDTGHLCNNSHCKEWKCELIIVSVIASIGIILNNFSLAVLAEEKMWKSCENRI